MAQTKIEGNLQEVNKTHPCPHCGKSDWCYRLGELSVCKRNAEPALDWKLTSKADQEGHFYYAPISSERPRKPLRAAQKRIWNYPQRNGHPLVRVTRLDDGKGHKKIWQEHQKNHQWVKGLKNVKRLDIPVYRYRDIQKAIAEGDTIFIVEGETCADALWELGLAATTNIGGAGKWKASDTADLQKAKQIVLCPDQDQPGLKHAEAIAVDFPHAQWLYPYPDSPLWNNLPNSQGLDIADWIAEAQLSATDIQAHLETRRPLLENNLALAQGNPLVQSDPTLAQSNPALAQYNLALAKKGKTPEINFSQILDRLDEIEKIPCSGERKWLRAKLAKQCHLSVSQLIDIYHSAQRNQPAFEGIGIQDLLAKTPERFDWLIAGLMPLATTALLYAEAETGKTLLVHNLIKAIAGGQNWNGYPTKTGKVLYVQTDEPEVNTAQNLKEAGFDTIPNQNLTLFFHWQFSQMAKLREKVQKEKPVLVVIDSLTSSNRTATIEEKNQEYARGLYELRDIALESGCAIIVLHHENKNGGIRGTSAIKANVSEVWHLKRCEKLTPNHRLLGIEKSRSGCIGVRQLELEAEDLSWSDQGEYDPDNQQRGRRPTGAQLLSFFQQHLGRKFEPQELVEQLGKGLEAIRKALFRLYRSGLIDCEGRVKTTQQGNQSRYRVYFAPSASDSSPSPISSEVELSDALSETSSPQESVQPFNSLSKNSPAPITSKVELSDTLLDNSSPQESVQQLNSPSDSLRSPITSGIELSDTLLDNSQSQESVQESVRQLKPMPDQDLGAVGHHRSPLERLIDWVRYQGQSWMVATQDNNILKLRPAGSQTIVHTVHLSQVEIGGYKA